MFFLSDQVNACISELDLLLSTYIQSDCTRNSFDGYLVYTYLIIIQLIFPNLIRGKIDGYKVHSTCISIDIEIQLLRKRYSHITCTYCVFSVLHPNSFRLFLRPCYMSTSQHSFFISVDTAIQ